jgi:acyl carrier protein
MDYGVDSILVVKIIAEIKDSCDVQLMPDVFFDCATIENLVKYIKNEKQN